MKSSLNRSTMKKMETEKSKKRSNILISDGRVKSYNDIDKHLVKKSNFEKISYESKKKKTSGGVDLQKMLIEQYQQSNALLAQNINTLLLLNQQAAANHISPNTDTVLDDNLKSPPYTAVLRKTPTTSLKALPMMKPTLNCSSLSKKIIGKARSNVNNCPSLHTISTKAAYVKHSTCEPVTTGKSSTCTGSDVKPINGITTVTARNVTRYKVAHESHVECDIQSQLSLDHNKKTSREPHAIIQNQVKCKLRSDLPLVRDKYILENAKHSKQNMRTRTSILNSSKKNDSIKPQCSQNSENKSRRSSHLNQVVSAIKPNIINCMKQERKDQRKEHSLGDITKFLLPQSEGGVVTQSLYPLSVNEKDPSKHAMVSTFPSTAKSSLSSPSTQSPALIMKSILNARLPKTPPINDPRLSTGRIRSNSISNLSDSGESLLSTSGNIGDSILNDSFMKVRRLSVGSDKSDISEKSNGTKISKSPLKHDGPRLSLSEYQKRRKDSTKTKVSHEINVTIHSPSRSVVDNSNVISTLNAIPSIVQDQLATSNSIRGKYKKNRTKVSTSQSSMQALEQNCDGNNATQAEFCIIHPNMKCGDDDFFIPKKASYFSFCAEKSTNTVSDNNVIEQRVLEHLSAGYSDGDGVETQRKIHENAESDTLLDIHKGRNLKVGTEAEGAKTSKVRIDDDIEFEYQSFLKSIGVTLKTKVCDSKQENEDRNCASMQDSSKNDVAVTTTKYNLNCSEKSAQTNVSPCMKTKRLLLNMNSNSLNICRSASLSGSKKGTVCSSLNDTIMMGTVDLDISTEPTKSSEITTFSITARSSISDSPLSILNRRITTSAGSIKPAVMKGDDTTVVYHKLFVEPLSSVKFSPISPSNTERKHLNLILPINNVKTSLITSNITNQVSQGNRVLRISKKNNSQNVQEDTNPVDVKKCKQSVKKLKNERNDSDVMLTVGKLGEMPRDFDNDDTTKKRFISDDLSIKNSLTLKRLDIANVSKYNAEHILSRDPSLGVATLGEKSNISFNISLAEEQVPSSDLQSSTEMSHSNIDVLPCDSPGSDIEKPAAIVQYTDTYSETVVNSFLSSEINGPVAISDGKSQKESPIKSNQLETAGTIDIEYRNKLCRPYDESLDCTDPDDSCQFKPVADDDNLSAVAKFDNHFSTNVIKTSKDILTTTTNTAQKESESCKLANILKLNSVSQVVSHMESDKYEETRVSSIGNSNTENLTLLIDCAKMCTTVSSSSENSFGTYFSEDSCNKYNTEQSNISSFSLHEYSAPFYNKVDGNETVDMDSTAYFIPEGLSKLEQLASVAMSESQGLQNGLPRSHKKFQSITVSSPHHASMIDLQFLIPPTTPGKPSTEDDTGKGSIKIAKRKTGWAVTPKRRNLRVRSRRIVSNREASPVNADKLPLSSGIAGKQSKSSLPAFSEPCKLNDDLGEKTTKKKSEQVKPRGSHSCERCGKHFTLARLLNSHIKRDHPEEESETKGDVSRSMESTSVNLLDDLATKEENYKEMVEEIIEKEEKLNTHNLHVANISESGGKVGKFEKGRNGPLKNANDETENKDVKKIVENTDDVKKLESLGEELQKEKSLLRSSKRNLSISSPEYSCQSHQANNDSIEKTNNLESLTLGSFQNVPSADLVLVKRTKFQREGKVETKRNIEKPKSIDGEESDGIANSIRNKIQKLLSCSDSNYDSVTDPTSYPEGVGKRQSKATLKGKAFMEELHSQKSRRKRSKPQINPNPELKEMIGATVVRLPNIYMVDDKSADPSKEETCSVKSNSLPSSKSNSLLSMVAIGWEMQHDAIQSDTKTDKKTTVSCIEKIKELNKSKGAESDVLSEKGTPGEIASDKIVKIAMSNPPTKRKYKCKICCSEFWKEQNFTKHSLKHNQRTYDCYKCTETFTTMRALTKHLLIHEDVRYASTERPHDCEQCGYKCETENQLIVHKKVHEIHTCTLCFTKCKYLKELNNHISKYHPESVEQVMRCTSCGQGFDSISEFRKHLNEIHKMTTKQASVACRNKGVIPDQLKKDEERKKGKMEEQIKESEEKKGVKCMMIKSSVLDMKNGNKILHKKNAHKAKEVIQRSRKVKMILRRDASLLKASDGISSEISFIATKDTNNSTAYSCSERKVLDTNNDITIEKPEISSVRKLRSHGKSTQHDELKDIELSKVESENANGYDKAIENKKTPGKRSDMELTNLKTMGERKDFDRKTKLKLPMNNLEIIFDRVEAQWKDETMYPVDTHKSPSRQNSREELKSPKSSNELSNEAWKLDMKSPSHGRDTLKISIKSPSQEKKLSPANNCPLLDAGVNVKINAVDVADKVLSEEEQKELKLKVESAERTARMLIRNQRRSSDAPQNKKSRKNSERMDFSATDSLPFERIEPVKIKVQVKMSELDRETTSFVLTSPEHFDIKEIELAKKNSKRKEKRKSGRVGHKDSSKRSYKSRKRSRLTTLNEGNEDLKDNITLGLEYLLDENFSLTESDEIPCLLPRDIDFDKEYDYRNQSEEKTFLTEDDLMSSLMTLADCAVDAHMIEMKDVRYQEINDERIKDDVGQIPDNVKDIDADVKEIMNELTSNVCSDLPDSKIEFKQSHGLELVSEPDEIAVEEFPSQQIGEQGDCFTPTPTLDHDYSGNFTFDLRDEINQQGGKSEPRDRILEHGYYRKNGEETTLEKFQNKSSSCTMNQSNELSIECSNAMKDVTDCKKSLLQICDVNDAHSNNVSNHFAAPGFFKKRTCSKHEANDSRDDDINYEMFKPNIDFVSVKIGPSTGMSNDSNLTLCKENKKNYSNMVNSSPVDNSISSALQESSGSPNIICYNRYNCSQKVPGRWLASEESGDDENWLIPEVTQRYVSGRFADSDVIIKTEEDAYDIDVQATDLNDISALNTPYEVIHNIDGRQDHSSLSSDKFYSFENNVCDNSTNERVRNIVGNELQPTDDNTLDTDSVITLCPDIIHKTVSDLIVQSGVTFYCRYCRRKYRKESSVKQHTLTHINSIKHPFKCLYCPSSFRKCSEYVDHKSIHLTVNDTIDSTDKSVESDSVGSKQDTLCSQRYSLKIDVSKPHCKTQKEIGCKYCAMNFDNKFSYILHLQNNHNIWDRNEKKFSSTNIKCFKCDMNFSCRKTLIRHEIFTHSQKTDDNRCLICGRTFLKKIYLKSHSRIHQGKYPFRCLQCEKGFRKQYQLYNHVTNHEKI